MASADERRTVLIVTAGLSRSGKSTAMNNIFGANFVSVYSASSVTREVEARCIGGHRDELVVVDTPGLASTDISLGILKKELNASIGGLNFVLVYCYSVSPSNPQTVADVLVVKNLQKVLGKDIWKKCVVLFTFSDILREQECPKEGDREHYKGFLRSHAEKLSAMLHKECGSHVPEVRTVFDVNQAQEIISEIVAIPVGRKLKLGREANVLVPGTNTLKWQEMAFQEIIRKADPIDRDVYMSFSIAPMCGSMVGGALGGAAVGAMGGAVIGFAAFGVGAVPGAIAGGSLGAFAGIVGGGVSGGSVTKTNVISKNKVKSNQIRKLRDAPRVNHNPQSPEPDFQTGTSNLSLHSNPETRHDRSTSASETNTGRFSAPARSGPHCRQLEGSIPHPIGAMESGIPEPVEEVPFEMSVSDTSLIQAESTDSTQPVVVEEEPERADSVQT